LHPPGTPPIQPPEGREGRARTDAKRSPGDSNLAPEGAGTRTRVATLTKAAPRRRPLSAVR